MCCQCLGQLQCTERDDPSWGQTEEGGVEAQGKVISMLAYRELAIDGKGPSRCLPSDFTSLEPITIPVIIWYIKSPTYVTMSQPLQNCTKVMNSPPAPTHLSNKMLPDTLRCSAGALTLPCSSFSSPSLRCLLPYVMLPIPPAEKQLLWVFFPILLLPKANFRSTFLET